MSISSILLDRLLASRIPPAAKRAITSLRDARNQRLEKRLKGRLAQDVRYCNICGWRGQQFDRRYNEIMRREEEIACPHCLSEPRQRALFKYLREKLLSSYLYTMKRGSFLCLEVSPDRSNPVEKALKNAVYISIDLEPSHAMFGMDLTKLTFTDNTFNLVVCPHVLEHIKDDQAAIAQIYRVLDEGGTALIQVPVGYYDDPCGESTMEFDPPPFYHHHRSYGWDFKKKLEKAGFKVNIIRYTDADMRLDMENEAIFECRKPPPQGQR